MTDVRVALQKSPIGCESVTASTTSAAPPYSVAEAAALLGLSKSCLNAAYADLGGQKVGGRILIPRHTVDGLVYGPHGAPDSTPVLARIRALIPGLSEYERMEVARWALSPEGSNGKGR